MCNRPIVAAAAVLLMSGCALHPVPEDVTGVDTYHIVRQIRCETREATKEFVIRELRRLAADHEDQAGDPIAQRIVADYDRDPESISNFRPEVFAGPQYAQVRNLYKVIYTSAVAYNFDLTMTENDDLGANANIVGPWTGATFTLGLGANANRERKNERQFTITDTLGPLLTQLNRPVRGVRYCDGQIRIANYAYPIAGRIGVDKMVKTFFELALFTNLDAEKAGAPPTMADKLTFTTLVDLTVAPKVVFSPVTSGFQPSDANLTGVVRRTDAHQVIVGLSLDNSKNGIAVIGSLRGYLFSRERSGGGAVASGAGGSVLLATSVTAHAATPAQQLAVLAVDQLKSREVQLVPR
jgi:hypothetical protein